MHDGEPGTALLTSNKRRLRKFRCTSRIAHWVYLEQGKSADLVHCLCNFSIRGLVQKKCIDDHNRLSSVGPCVVPQAGDQAKQMEQLKALTQWVTLRIRIWASLHCQTLIRTVHGQSDMRQALVDLATTELHEIWDGPEIVLQHCHITETSTPTEVGEWLRELSFGHGEKWENQFQLAGMTMSQLREVHEIHFDFFGRRSTMSQIRALPPPQHHHQVRGHAKRGGAVRGRRGTGSGSATAMAASPMA